MTKVAQFVEHSANRTHGKASAGFLLALIDFEIQFVLYRNLNFSKTSVNHLYIAYCEVKSDRKGKFCLLFVMSYFSLRNGLMSPTHCSINDWRVKEMFEQSKCWLCELRVMF